MAVCLDMNRGHISHIEREKREGGLVALQIIATRFSTTMSRVLTGLREGWMAISIGGADQRLRLLRGLGKHLASSLECPEPRHFNELENFVIGKMSLVRPSAASLNSLAEVLRQAQPVYAECRSILNYLDQGSGIVFLTPVDDSTTAPDGIPASKDAPSLPHTVFEPTARYGKGIV